MMAYGQLYKCDRLHSSTLITSLIKTAEECTQCTKSPELQLAANRYNRHWLKRNVQQAAEGNYRLPAGTLDGYRRDSRPD